METRSNLITVNKDDIRINVSPTLTTVEVFAEFLNNNRINKYDSLNYININSSDCYIYWSNSRKQFCYKKKYSNFPITHVNYFGALRCCQFYGGRLIKTYEWDYLATNGKSTKYPWGNEYPTSSHCNHSFNVGSPTNVFDYPPSFYGIYDLYGNLWEWVYSPTNLSNLKWNNAIIKGGGWSYSVQNIIYRTECKVWSLDTGNCIGFRIAYDI